MDKTCVILILACLIGSGHAALRSTLTWSRVEYTFWTADMDYTDFYGAVSGCAFHGKDSMVAITNSETQQVVYYLVEPWIDRDIWIGLNDDFVEQSWYWLDGTNSIDGFTSWATVPTQDTSRNCAFAPDGQTWQAYDCSANHGFVCQNANKINGKSASVFVSDERPAVQESGNVLITCTVAASDLSEVTWYKNGKVVSQSLNQRIRQALGKGSSTLLITNASVEDAGFYTCSSTKLVDGVEERIMGMSRLTVLPAN